MKRKHARHGRSHGRGRSDEIPGLWDGVFEGVWGAIFNDADIIAGTGFTAEWNKEDLSASGEHFYTIRFDTPFTNPPVVVLTPNNDNPPNIEGRYTATLITRNVAYIEVTTQDVDDADAAAHDGGFDFLAMEPAV